MDVANWQPLDLTDLIRQHNIKHVVVRGYLPWERPSNDIAKAQIASARSNGCSVGMYFWCYRANDPKETIRAAKDVLDDCGVGGILWLDCETYVIDQIVEDLGPDAAWLREAGQAADKLGIEIGIYSGLWWLQSFLTGYSEFADWPLWLADYTGIPDLDSVTLPDGWQRDRLMGHQYAADRVDLDIFRS